MHFNHAQVTDTPRSTKGGGVSERVTIRGWQEGKKNKKQKTKKMEEAESEQPGSPKEAFIER